MAQKQLIITIGREFGSGGRVIGKALAERFGIGFYDSEIHGDKMPAGALELTAAEYRTLLDGQSAGKQIIAVGGLPVLADHERPITVIASMTLQYSPMSVIRRWQTIFVIAG